eukprot:910515-Amorphochlora_amoeboformis.AAC.2
MVGVRNREGDCHDDMSPCVQLCHLAGVYLAFVGLSTAAGDQEGTQRWGILFLFSSQPWMRRIADDGFDSIVNSG